MAQVAGLDPDQSTDTLTVSDWQQLFQRWQEWLQALDKSEFQPMLTYKIHGTWLGWSEPAKDIQACSATATTWHS